MNTVKQAVVSDVTVLTVKGDVSKHGHVADGPRRIKTTEAKAKELRQMPTRSSPWVAGSPVLLDTLSGEQLRAAQARRLHFIRRARRWVNNPEALERLFGEYAERYKQRQVATRGSGRWV